MSRKLSLICAVCVAVMATAVTGGVDAKGKVKNKKLTASRAQVSDACAANNGTEWGTQSSGGYGCISDDGWIDCNSNGECEGGRAERQSGQSRDTGPKNAPFGLGQNKVLAR